MKEQKLYVCEFCNTQFKDKQSALKCEKNHHKPKEIQKLHYHRASCPQDGYPDKIDIVFDDNSIIRYKR